MLHFLKKRSWLALALILSLLDGGATAGTNVSSGNGRGIVFRDGHVRFLDMLSSDELSQAIATRSALNIDQVWERSFVQERYVRTIASKKSGFFSCAISKLTPFVGRMPVLQSVLDQLNGVQVYEVKYPFTNSISEKDLDQLDQGFPEVSAPSDRVRDPQLQQPLAIYAKNVLVVSKLTGMLPPDDRCALEIHETLRLLNNNPGLLDHPLTTQQVENLTRYFMGLRPINVKDSDDAIMDLLNGFSPQYADTAIQYYTKMMQALNAQIGHCNVSSPGWQTLHEERQNYWNKISELQAGEMGFLVGEPMTQQIVRFGIIGIGEISNILTKPLPFGVCWDIKTQNKASCPW